MRPLLAHAALATLALAALALGTLAGCDPYLTARTTAPPGRAARLDPIDGFWGVTGYRLELSRGVAFAMTCNLDGPCEHMTVTSDAPQIAEVRPATIAALEPSHALGGGASAATTAATVVVGKAPGVTKLHVRTSGRERTVDVTVIAAPSHGVSVGTR